MQKAVDLAGEGGGEGDIISMWGMRMFAIIMQFDFLRVFHQV